MREKGSLRGLKPIEFLLWKGNQYQCWRSYVCCFRWSLLFSPLRPELLKLDFTGENASMRCLFSKIALISFIIFNFLMSLRNSVDFLKSSWEMRFLEEDCGVIFRLRELTWYLEIICVGELMRLDGGIALLGSKWIWLLRITSQGNFILLVCISDSLIFPNLLTNYSTFLEGVERFEDWGKLLNSLEKWRRWELRVGCFFLRESWVLSRGYYWSLLRSITLRLLL